MMISTINSMKMNCQVIEVGELKMDIVESRHPQEAKPEFRKVVTGAGIT